MKISVVEDVCLPGATNYKVSTSISNSDISLVLDLIYNNFREWKVEVIKNTISKVDTTRIRGERSIELNQIE